MNIAQWKNQAKHRNMDYTEAAAANMRDTISLATDNQFLYNWSDRVFGQHRG